MSISDVKNDYPSSMDIIHLYGLKETYITLKKIIKAKVFCQDLKEKGIDYSFFIRHPEVLGCDESRKYYQYYFDYIGEDYGVGKHLFIQERKGQKRKYLVIVDDSKTVDLKVLKEKLESSKLEFVKEDMMLDLLDTTPGNVSLFNIQFDKNEEVQLIIDQELLEKELIAFHPLYNGMSIFITPDMVFRYLSSIGRSASIIDIPCKEKEYVLEKTL